MNGGGGGTVGVAGGAPVAGGTAAGPSTGAGGAPAGTGVVTPSPAPPAPTPAPDPSSPSPADVVCTTPPPACPLGLSPSYAPAGFWHCMPVCDPNNQDLVVISYGGIYGNGGVCAAPPPQTACPVAGQVWTWNYVSEEWDCEQECNNGQYDQRQYSNQTVCVPC
jgi:hypothetical protein